jgi:CheY-like chemotaxis protein
MYDRTVLIVEDTEISAATLEVALLSVPGILVTLLPSAREALLVFDDPSVRIAALITDLHMPEMDGFELIARVRADSRYAHLPIIVVSGDSDPETPRRTAQLGADAFFLKPYSPAAVRHTLEQLLDAEATPA